MERPLVKIADTWEEMAEYIGCDAETLKATVSEWNDFCDHGKDKLFVKREDYLRPLRKPPLDVYKRQGSCSPAPKPVYQLDVSSADRPAQTHFLC